MPDRGAAPGTLLHREPFERDVPFGVRGTRILHATTITGGVAETASAIVLVPPAAAGRRGVVVWMHGTTGVASGCAPSLLERPFAHTPALEEALAHGWIVVAPDYAGLGTRGTHGYLVGEDEGRAAIDSLRAARSLPEVGPVGPIVVWGHSQGGHAALWAATLAPSYAPELALSGVAVAAPASMPGPLMRAAQDSPVGRIMTSYVIRAYAARYPDVDPAALVRPAARLLVADMARRCLAGKPALVSVLEAWLLDAPVLTGDPTQGALGARLDENVPRGPIGVPVLIAQGTLDDLVLPGVQDGYVAGRCAAGQAIDYRRYAGDDHLSLVSDASRFPAELVAWTHERIQGTAAPAGCTVATRAVPPRRVR